MAFGSIIDKWLFDKWLLIQKQIDEWLLVHRNLLHKCSTVTSMNQSCCKFRCLKEINRYVCENGNQGPRQERRGGCCAGCHPRKILDKPLLVQRKSLHKCSSVTSRVVNFVSQKRLINTGAEIR